MAETSFKTFSARSRAKLARKGSRFFGFGTFCREKQELENFRKNLYEQFPRADHLVSASIVLESNRPVKRYNSNGEPSGTAGEPILQVLSGEGLINCAIFVARFFGGTELGTGGLVRAYSDTARAVIERAEVVIREIVARYRISFSYRFTGEVEKVLAGYEGVEVLSRDYDQRCRMQVSVPLEKEEGFSDHLRRVTSGEVEFERLEGKDFVRR